MEPPTYAAEAVIEGIGLLTDDEGHSVKALTSSNAFSVWYAEHNQLRLSWNIHAATLTAAITTASNTLSLILTATSAHNPEPSFFEVRKVGPA